MTTSQHYFVIDYDVRHEELEFEVIDESEFQRRIAERLFTVDSLVIRGGTRVEFELVVTEKFREKAIREARVPGNLILMMAANRVRNERIAALEQASVEEVLGLK